MFKFAAALLAKCSITCTPESSLLQALHDIRPHRGIHQPLKPLKRGELIADPIQGGRLLELSNHRLHRPDSELALLPLLLELGLNRCEFLPQPLVLGLQVLGPPGATCNLHILRGDLALEERDNGGGLLHQLVLEELSLELGLAVAKLVDEAEEVSDIRGAGLDLGAGTGEVSGEGGFGGSALARGGGRERRLGRCIVLG